MAGTIKKQSEKEEERVIEKRKSVLRCSIIEASKEAIRLQKRSVPT
jgi:hypothetical protein